VRATCCSWIGWSVHVINIVSRSVGMLLCADFCLPAFIRAYSLFFTFSTQFLQLTIIQWDMTRKSGRWFC
ncbi:MAG: hypothetical protein ACKPKO_20085, partial [Candidatus Fonsibacter sp.]